MVTRRKLRAAVEKYASIDELVFDATLFVMLLVLTRLFGSESVILILHPIVLIVLMLLMEVLVPLYLAMIYTRFRERAKSSLFYGIMAKTALLVGFCASVVLCYYMPFVASEYTGSGLLSGYAFINTVLGLLMVMMGWDLGTRIDAGTERKTSQGLSTALLVVNYAFMPLVMIATMIHSAMIKSWVPFLAAGACYTITYVLALKTDRIDAFFSRDFVKTYVIPCLLCGLFSLSMDFMNDLLPVHFRDHALVALAASGILPVRVLLLACPPVKPVNLAVGVAAIAFLIAGWMSL